MGSTYRASAFNFIFNSVSTLIIIINGIVMVPIYFHYMSVSTYGAWLATGNVVAMLGLIESGFSSVITQKMSVATASGDEEGFLKLAGANLVTSLFFSSIILAIGLAISPFVCGWVNADPADKNALNIAFIIALISSCLSICLSLLNAFPQVWQDTKSTGMISTVNNVVSIVFLILFLVAGCGVVSIALSYFVRAVSNLVLQGRWIFKQWKIRGLKKPIYDLNTVKELSKACVYPFLSKMSVVLMGNSQSFIIALFMNPGLAAVYDLTTKVCTVACTFVSNTNGSFFALFSLTLASKDKTKIDNVFKNTSSFFFISLISVCMFSLCFTEPVIKYWVGLDKFGGTTLLAVAVFAKMVSLVRSYFNNIIYTGGFINKSAKLDILCSTMYIIVLLLIIKKTQMYAVPLATAISCLFFLIWYVRIIRKNMSINMNFLLWIAIKSLLLTVPFIVFHFVSSMDYNNLPAYAIYFIVFCILYAAIIFISNREFAVQITNKFIKHK